jgi:hypothetical protein
VFGKRVLRRIFGHKREDVVRGWRRLHNELHNLYASPNIVKVIESRTMRLLVGHVARMEHMEKAYKILVGKPQEKRPFRRWDDST